VRFRLLVAAVAAACLALAPGTAFGGTARVATRTAYDVSYPQCGGALPASPRGGIVGVNGGVVFAANPCLATQWSWARTGSTYAPAFYANTANPGPAYSGHWPAGQQTPQPCDGSNSTACAYDYGWNAAKDSFADAQTVTADPRTFAWWLDVETGNSWETLEAAYGSSDAARAADRSALAGAVAALVDSGVTSVGMYSTSSQWQQITGGTANQFAGSPEWVAGTGSASTAVKNCSQTSFTGGRVALAQYAHNGFDADYHC
jgi:hypothetical protein